MSGPVRAQGKSNKPTSILKQSSHLDDAFEESNRPSKRRRQSDPIDLVNDDRSATDSTRNRSPRTSPLAPSKSKGKRLAREIDEFRDTEKMLACSPRRARDTRGSSRTSNIERFTEVATQQRRERFDARNSSSKPNGHSERASRSLLLDGNEGSTKYTGDQSTVSSDTARRSDRESPDELQGDVTTDRIPISWAEKTHTTNPRNAKSLVEKLIRKRSPTDIQTTDFAGSPQQGPKRTKRSHKKASFSIPLKSTFFRIGHFTQSFKKEEPAILQLREDGLNISEDLLDGGSNIEILFRHVSQVLVAEEPSHKVRMKLLQGSTRAGQILDIDFPAKLQKAALITKLQHSDVAIIEKDVYALLYGVYFQGFIC
jgi:hypothetical protein